MFLNVTGARCARDRNKYVSTETNGVDLKHFEKALTPFDHTSSIATTPIRLETSRHPYPSAHPMNGLATMNNTLEDTLRQHTRAPRLGTAAA
ncbi:MAG TPA: hypothetical protein VMT08_00270 [Bradyrhizobium sp.]|nr:hypothetical protein [Bradyrhizobium sp.]